MNAQNRRFGGRGGQTLIMVTLALVPMFGMMGLVVDLGYMHYVKIQAQTAAEAAAKAAIIDVHATVGGSILNCASVTCAATPVACTASIVNPTNSIDRGCMYAQKNGFNSTGNQTVTYQAGISGAPPTATGIGSVSYWVTYRAVQKVPQLFSAILGAGFQNGMVAARSTAVIVGASDCIYALHHGNTYGAVSLGGTTNLNSSCGLYVNSSADPGALACNGGGTYNVPELDVHGSASCGNTSGVTPNNHVSEVQDPLAGLAVPATAPYSCDFTNYPPNGDRTLSPGVYCGGLHVGNQTITLSAGTYILVGGGLTTQSANSHIDGTAGVLIYNTKDATHAYGPISIHANSTVNMKAGVTGTYAGILYFEDRTAPAGSADDFGGGSTSALEGTIYALNSSVTMHGNAAALSKYMLLVCDTISMVGTTQFNNDYSSLPNGSPIQTISIVE
jgi:hypothetical protein